MSKPRLRRKTKPDKRQKALWYLSHGYPQTFIADKLGVHRNTVRTWAREDGYNRRSFLRLAQRIKNLHPADRAKLREHVWGYEVTP